MRKLLEYVFEQIICFGEREDIDFLRTYLKTLAFHTIKNNTLTNYFITYCINALGKL